MTTYPEVFKRATGEYLRAGTINVDVGQRIEIREEFRIRGADMSEPDQDLLFERCCINGYPANRIRPFQKSTGEGGHGDDILEIACSKEVPNVAHGSTVEIESFR